MELLNSMYSVVVTGQERLNHKGRGHDPTFEKLSQVISRRRRREEMNVALAGKDAEVIKLWDSDAAVSKGRGAGETGNMSGFLEYEGEKWDWRAGTDSGDEARGEGSGGRTREGEESTEDGGQTQLGQVESGDPTKRLANSRKQS